MRAVEQRHPFGEEFFAETVLQEGVVLLEVEASEGGEDGGDSLVGDLAVEHQGAFASGDAARAYLGDGGIKGLAADGGAVQVFAEHAGIPPVAAVFAAAGIFYGDLHSVGVAGFGMQGFKAAAVDHIAVFQIVGVFALLGNQLPAFSGRRPDARAQGLLPAVCGRDAFVAGVVQSQFEAGYCCLRLPFRGREVAAGIGGQHAGGLHGIAHEFAQCRFFQPVGGEGTVAAVREDADFQAPVLAGGHLVHFAVERCHQVHAALGERHADLVGAGLQGHRHATAG